MSPRDTEDVCMVCQGFFVGGMHSCLFMFLTCFVYFYVD